MNITRGMPAMGSEAGAAPANRATVWLAPGRPNVSPVRTLVPALPNAHVAAACCTCPHSLADAARAVRLSCLLCMLLLHAPACSQFFSGKRTRMAPVASDAWSPKCRSCNPSLSWTPALVLRMCQLHAQACAYCC